MISAERSLNGGRENLNHLHNNMSKVPDKRTTENARIVADALKFLAADQRRANKSQKSVQKLKGKLAKARGSSFL
jgi:hypothetical protein